MKNMSISKALMWIFIAEILGILAAVIPVVGGILSIIAFVLNLLALYGASKLDDGYKTAFVLSIAGIVVSVLNSIIKGAVFSGILDIIAAVISLGILYYVIMTTVKHLGGSDVAAKGLTVWKLNLICIAASVILSILSLLMPLLAFLSIIIAIVEVVAGILYLVFLYKASKALA